VNLAVDYLSLPREGERENGDAALVRRWDGGALIAVLDALGHGPAAAEAARVGMSFLSEAVIPMGPQAAPNPGALRAPGAGGLRYLVIDLHERLRGTRGAAALLLLVKGDKLEGCGIGNVEMRSYHSRVPALLTPGVLGNGTLGKLRVFQADLVAGTRMVVHSDGVEGRFDDVASLHRPALSTCKAIMEKHRRPHDDATVLVIDVEAT
jgi:negative regulator of sigma-B (phosphoserine phosphatase)